MSKKTLALILATCAPTLTFADPSNTTIYGTLDLDVESAK